MTEPTRVHVPLGERAYDILIGENLLEGAGERLTAMFPGRRIPPPSPVMQALRQLEQETAAAERKAARKAKKEEAEPQADLNASIEYREHLAKVLTRRAVEAAS